MGEIVYIQNDRVVTDSLTVAEVFRKEHKHVVRDIRNQIEKLKEANQEKFSQSNFGQSDYTNERGKTYSKYILTEKAFTLVTMAYNTVEAMAFKVKYIEEFDRMRNLLGNRNSNLPSSFSEALRLAADLQEEKEQLEAQNKILLPKAEEHDHFMDSKGMQEMNDVAKALKVGRNNLFKFLREDEIKVILKDRATPYQKYIDSEWFKVIDVEKNGFIISKTYATTKGISGISKLLRKYMMDYSYMKQYEKKVFSSQMLQVIK